MALRSDEGEGGKDDRRQPEKACNRLVGPNPARNGDLCSPGIIGVVSVAVEELDDQAVLAGIHPEAEVHGFAAHNGSFRRGIGVFPCRICFCFILTGGEGFRIHAVFLVDHVPHELVMGGRRRFDVHGDANGNVRHVVSGNGHAPNQADVFGGLGPSVGRLVLRIERHREEGEREHDDGHAEEHEDVPACSLEGLKTRFKRHFFQHVIAVFVHQNLGGNAFDAFPEVRTLVLDHAGRVRYPTLEILGRELGLVSDGVKNEGRSAPHMLLNLAILSRGPRLYSTRRLVEEAQQRGLDVTVVDPLACSLLVDDGRVAVLVNGDPFPHDAVIPRIGHSVTGHGTALLRHLDQLGVWTANSATSILQSRDKLRASQLLARNRIPIPRTMNVRSVKDVDHAIDAVGGLPVVVKVTKGTQGQGVFLRHTAYEARSLVQGLLHARRDVLVQEYVAESHGRDIRVIIVGDEVVAAMRRRARGREFRSNFHLNGTVEPVDLPEEFAEVARRAARVLGLNIAGVDLLEGANGPMVLEVNSSPGLQGIEAASGVNVAGAIIDHAARESGFCEVQLDGLLRTLPEDGVATVIVRRHPGLIGRTLEEVFRGEVQVFGLTRNHRMEWNPDPDIRLRFDDMVLCTGPRASLRRSLRDAIERNQPEMGSIPEDLARSEGD